MVGSLNKGLSERIRRILTRVGYQMQDSEHHKLISSTENAILRSDSVDSQIKLQLCALLCRVIGHDNVRWRNGSFYAHLSRRNSTGVFLLKLFLSTFFLFFLKGFGVWRMVIVGRWTWGNIWHILEIQTMMVHPMIWAWQEFWNFFFIFLKFSVCIHLYTAKELCLSIDDCKAQFEDKNLAFIFTTVCLVCHLSTSRAPRIFFLFLLGFDFWFFSASCCTLYLMKTEL